jgi:hypothetical protein
LHATPRASISPTRSPFGNGATRLTVAERAVIRQGQYSFRSAVVGA